MRTCKLLVNPATALTATGGVTFANPGAKPGEIGTSSRSVVEIVEIPDNVDNETVRRAYAGTADLTWLSCNTPRYTFRFAELGQGVIIRS